MTVVRNILLVLLLGWTAMRLTQRAREESADRRISILVDWSEVREEAARQGITDAQLLERLKNSGVNALLVGASTVQDYLWDGMTFSNRVLGQAVQSQLQARGVVAGIKNWERLKDLEVGFNPELLGKARQAGFHLVLRVNHDPWLAPEKLFADLEEISSANQEMGFLLNTDEVPGGIEALPEWRAFLESHHYSQLLFEFHPSKSALKLAHRTPKSTYRAHTIASNELKDMSSAQQNARWKRAVEERSCRFLLFHISPNHSLTSFLESVYNARQNFSRQRWQIAWPAPRMTWAFPSLFERKVAPLLSLIVAILIPMLALPVGLTNKAWLSFAQIVGLSLMGACLVAALAENPLTRLQIVPFRGIKLAIAAAWVGSFAWLYTWKEIKDQLYQNVRRIDVVMGIGLVGIMAYLLLRTGNVGSGWKSGWEKGLREGLEQLLVARPRFKEFALGYPLLILGLHLPRKNWGRVLIGLGMIGPISMINTFCHLHSPLYLAFWRSMNGIVIGAIIGFVLVQTVRWGMSRYET